MLTADELDRLVAACAGAGCPVLLTHLGDRPGRARARRSAGRSASPTRSTPTSGARSTGGGCSARTRSAPRREAFTRLGADVLVRPSPWRLGADQAALAAEWFAGWVDAACEQRPELAAAAAAYARRRLAQAAAGRLDVTVHHHDLLALPDDSGRDEPCRLGVSLAGERTGGERRSARLEAIGGRDESDVVDVGAPAGRRRDPRRAGLAAGHRPVPRRRPHDRRRGRWRRPPASRC